MAIENKELLDKAKKLELDADEYETEDELKSAIEEKEAEIKKEEEGNIDWKEKAKHLEEEAKKAFSVRDTAKKERRKANEVNKKLQEELDKVKSTLEGLPSKDELDELKQFKADVVKKKEEEELKNKNELEKAEIRHKKSIEDMEKSWSDKFEEFKKTQDEAQEVLEKKDKEISLLRQARLEREILEAAMNSNAIKPSQIVKLLKDEFTFDPDLGDNGRFVKHVVDVKGKLTDEVEVSDRVGEFLKDPDNDNLVKSDANTGGTGHRESNTGSAGTGEKGRKFFGTRRKEGEYDPKDPALLAEAEEKGLEVEDHIEILQKRDATKAKIREKAENA